MSDNRLRKIENALIGMGIKPNTNGFYWAVELTVGKIMTPMKSLKELYTEIAVGSRTSKGAVEHAVRSAVENADTHSEAYKKYIGTEFTTVKGFYPILAFNIRRELEDEQYNAMRQNE